MRGSSKALPKYAKHKASGNAVVRLSGKDIYLGPHGTKASRIEYDRIIGEWLANGRNLVESEATINVAKLVAIYWTYCKGYHVKNGKPTDELACIKIALRDVKRLYGKTPVDEFGPLALDAVREAMVKRGNARTYINANTGRIRRMFRWGVAKQVVPPAVFQALQALDGLKRGKCAAREPDPILPIDDVTVDATIAHCSDTVADMIRFQRLTGCRPGEVRSMKPCEIDRTKDVWRYTPGSHKMEHKGRARVILVGPKAQAILMPYLLRDESMTCFEKPSRGMFNRWNYNDAINRACDKAFPAPKGTTGDELKAWRKEHRWAPNRLCPTTRIAATYKSVYICTVLH